MFSAGYSWLAFAAVFLFRYIRLCVNVYAYYIGYKPTPIPEKLYPRDNITVILPTLGENAEELLITIQSALQNEPQKIVLVTPKVHLKRVEAMMQNVYEPARNRIKVLTSNMTNKRQQIVRALPDEVETPFVMLIDDDVKLPPTFSDWVLAPFANPNVGGVGTNQRVRRSEKPNFWEILGGIYLQRRNFDCTACNYMDGGLPCLSGRAVVYRSSILKDPEFMTQFNEESVSWFKKKYLLNADDDNFITRWLFKTGYDIRMQNHPDCEVETTLAPDRTYLRQCVRWSRSNWRSNLTSLFTERNVYLMYPWSTYAVFLTTVTQWALAMDLTMIYLLSRVVRGWDTYDTYIAYFLFFCWWLMSRFIKFVGYFRQYPMDLVNYGLLIIGFGYFHNFIKFFSACTILNTDWGSREDADRAPDNKERLRRLRD
ncbi:putative polysaccharide synthase Cps1 [Pseudovirgaria hyperparasitica]|uniref:Putative polysaccharide synthase Cps1 n=1 Tax=Pseudovirgaria hyperparasitica TaxID=470096 RepID=A0A6A6VTG0_9PEZI|nr:putative polysaccharide synthase Cps1 [Pseudovirgaria hyperparasitica]KAF2753169.1 putative polysaccharide synthase Cps1 [Pseudovirgaria hyperparasitica]